MKPLVPKFERLLGRPWWQGVGAIFAILAVVFYLLFECRAKPAAVEPPVPASPAFVESLALGSAPVQSTPVEPLKRERELLSGEGGAWRLNVDGSQLTEFHNEALALARTQYQDATLSGFAISVQPYSRTSRVFIYLYYYSAWADRRMVFYVSEASDLSLLKPSEQAEFDYQRTVLDQLPWEGAPEWAEFFRKAWEKVTPLSPSERTSGIMQTYESQGWLIDFEDGLNGDKFHFLWDGRNDPVRK